MRKMLLVNDKHLDCHHDYRNCDEDQNYGRDDDNVHQISSAIWHALAQFQKVLTHLNKREMFTLKIIFSFNLKFTIHISTIIV